MARAYPIREPGFGRTRAWRAGARHEDEGGDRSSSGGVRLRRLARPPTRHPAPRERRSTYVRTALEPSEPHPNEASASWRRPESWVLCSGPFARGAPARAPSSQGMPDQTIAHGQLALELPSALPAIAIEPEWKGQPRLWGHSLHPMCSYLASFPAALAHSFIARYSRPGDIVLDPFSGRGTAPLQALAEGRIGVGNDLNPLAQVLTAAKVEPGLPAETRTRLAALQLAWNADSAAWLALGERVVARPAHPSAFVPAAGSGGGPNARDEAVPDEVALAFHPRTLGQLLFVRSRLSLDDRVDRFLAGALAGILHGKTPSYLSTIMPNTFSMAPRYVRDFVAANGYE